MKTILIKKIAAVLLLIVLASCSAEDGKDGANGIDGINGINGSQGPAGTANVIYSNWIPANFTGTSASLKYMGIDFPAGMPSAFSIKDTHTILVYFTGWGDGNVYLLPVLDFRGAQFTYGFGTGSGGVSDITITAKALSGILNEYQIDPARGAKFRYVIIPGGVPAGRTTQNDFTKMSYDEVCNYLNIPK